MHERTKLILIFLIISLMVVPFASAGPIKNFITGTGKGGGGFWDAVKNIFMGSWLQDRTNVELAIRVMFFFLVFAVSFAVFRMISSAPRFEWLGGKTAVIVSLIFSLMGTWFAPKSILVDVWADYTVIAVLLFYGIVIGGGIWGAVVSYRNQHYWVAAILIIVLISMIDWVMGAVENVEQQARFKGLISIPFYYLLKRR